MASLPFFVYNCNGGADETFTPLDPSEHRSAPDAELVETIVRMHDAVFSVLHVEPFVGYDARAAEGSSSSPSAMSAREAEKVRHRVQCAAIAQQFERLGVVGNGHCHVEVGAGSAGVSLALAQSDAAQRDSHVLLDQFLPRQKADKVLREMGAQFERHKCLLQHVDVGALQRVRQQRVTVVAKHLCGSAADYALRAVARCTPPVAAFALASCCHHRCDFASYPNRAFFEKSGIGHADFARICRMSSWAVNGHNQPAPDVTDASEGEAGAQFRAAGGRLLSRRELGRCCKDLLDAGRVLYLKAMGYDAWLAEYVEAKVTPENVLLVARPALAVPSANDEPGDE